MTQSFASNIVGIVYHFLISHITFFCLQEALAIALEHDTARLNSDECYFNSFPKEMEKKRDAMVKLLFEAGFVPTIPEGGYFMMADASKIGKNNFIVSVIFNNSYSL